MKRRRAGMPAAFFCLGGGGKMVAAPRVADGGIRVFLEK